MDKIIFATANEGKMREIREIFKDAPYSVVSMKEAGITADIVEDGTTFEENALIKARGIAEALREYQGLLRWQMIRDLRWIFLIRLREFIPPGFWVRIPPMKLRISIFLIN